jgi:hypothetical protein
MTEDFVIVAVVVLGALGIGPLIASDDVAHRPIGEAVVRHDVGEGLPKKCQPRCCVSASQAPYRLAKIHIMGVSIKIIMHPTDCIGFWSISKNLTTTPIALSNAIIIRKMMAAKININIQHKVNTVDRTGIAVNSSYGGR